MKLLETSYKHHFENIIIICPTVRYNETYKNRPWILTDPNVCLIEPKVNIHLDTEIIIDFRPRRNVIHCRRYNSG